ncbi:MAG: hypothetical protein JKX82_00630 [Oleispira sp.]|nr:hypothetical protein [Oleispira sp.]
MSAQEEIAEFITTHSKIAEYSLKTKVKFQLYKDSLVMTQIDKKVVRSFNKKGLPLSTSFIHPFKKDETSHAVHYTFRNETEDYTIILESKAAKPSVRIRNKDTFSNTVTDALYFSI